MSLLRQIILFILLGFFTNTFATPLVHGLGESSQFRISHKCVLIVPIKTQTSAMEL